MAPAQCIQQPFPARVRAGRTWARSRTAQIGRSASFGTGARDRLQLPSSLSGTTGCTPREGRRGHRVDSCFVCFRAGSFRCPWLILRARAIARNGDKYRSARSTRASRGASRAPPVVAGGGARNLSVDVWGTPYTSVRRAAVLEHHSSRARRGKMVASATRSPGGAAGRQFLVRKPARHRACLSGRCVSLVRRTTPSVTSPSNIFRAPHREFPKFGSAGP